MKQSIIIILFLGFVFQINAQTPRNPMPRTINIPSKNHISPSLSGDGKHMVYVSNYSTSNKMVLKYSYLDENDQWSEPLEITTVSKTELDVLGGHWLTYDGSLLFFTSKRSPGIGQYDIFFSERKGRYWTPAQNVGKPVNSEGNEGHPSLSPDGRYLYFMRCNEMDNYKVDGCELFVAERKSDNYWHEPKRLPNPINTGNEASPRIMPDGETLVFASKRPGGKGGFDLYQSRFKNGNWSAPVACDYLNTDQDDHFISVPAHGKLAYFSTIFRGYHTIIEAQIPEQLQPKKVVLAQGKVLESSTGKPLDAVIQVYNARTRERDQFIKVKPDGTFFVLVKGDDIYDFSITTRENKHVYFSKLYDLRDLQQSLIEDLSVTLSPITNGYTLVADDILFQPLSSSIQPTSEVALLRLAKFLRDNPGYKLDIGVYLDEYKTDTIPGDPDLSEVITDTVWTEVPIPSYLESHLIDSLTIDSLNLYTIDTVYETTYAFDLNYTYHNDRTPAQAQAIYDKLLSLGVPPHLITATGYSDQKKRSTYYEPSFGHSNTWVEIKLVR